MQPSCLGDATVFTQDSLRPLFQQAFLYRPSRAWRFARHLAFAAPRTDPKARVSHSAQVGRAKRCATRNARVGASPLSPFWTH
jgi:hypothetical protein